MIISLGSCFFMINIDINFIIDITYSSTSWVKVNFWKFRFDKQLENNWNNTNFYMLIKEMLILERSCKRCGLWQDILHFFCIFHEFSYPPTSSQSRISSLRGQNTSTMFCNIKVINTQNKLTDKDHNCYLLFLPHF